MLTDRQLCLLSNSALEIKKLLERSIADQLTQAELIAALQDLEASASCIKTEIQYGFEITDVENHAAS